MRALAGGLAAQVLLVVLTTLPSGAVTAVDFSDGSGFTPVQQREIEQAVASAVEPVRVHVLSQVPRQDHGSASLTASRLSLAGSDLRPRIVVWGGPDALPAFGVAGDSDAHCAVLTVEESQLDEHQQFVELVRLVAAGTGCQAMDEALATRVRELRAQDRTGGTVQEPVDSTTWLLRAMVAGVGVLLAGALVFFWGRTLRGAWLRKRRSEAITGFASQAAQRSEGERAHADLLAFGEALDATELRSTDRMSAWQQALDEYAEACRIHDRGTGVRQDRRVIDLCASGRRHLDRAVQTRTG